MGVTYELLAPSETYQTQKVVATAKFAGLPLKVSYGQSPESLKELLPTARSLILRVIKPQSPPLLLSPSNSALRYLAQSRQDLTLYGNNSFASALVDQWLDFSMNDLEVPLQVKSQTNKGIVQVCIERFYR